MDTNNDNKVIIDFEVIDDYNDFYAQLKTKVDLGDDFGDNLDALYDSISGYIALPTFWEFINLSVMQLETFEDLLTTCEDAEENVEGFEFAYFMENYDVG